jgi:hypothetical protein
MITLPCPWCDHEVSLADLAAASSLRCDECATVVDLAPAPTPDAPTLLSIAA